MNDAIIVTAPHRIALGNPKIKNPIPVRSPYNTPTISDPLMTEPARVYNRVRISSACAGGSGPRITIVSRKREPSFKK